jgi:hypothetical protein
VRIGSTLTLFTFGLELSKTDWGRGGRQRRSVAEHGGGTGGVMREQFPIHNGVFCSQDTLPQPR